MEPLQAPLTINTAGLSDQERLPVCVTSTRTATAMMETNEGSAQQMKTVPRSLSMTFLYIFFRFWCESPVGFIHEVVMLHHYN